MICPHQSPVRVTQSAPREEGLVFCRPTPSSARGGEQGRPHCSARQNLDFKDTCPDLHVKPKISKPGLQAEKKPSSPLLQNEYCDDRPSGYTVSSLQAVRHPYILFVFMVSSVFFRLQSWLSISWA